MLSLRKQGLYCEVGDFYVDPSGVVEHSDHADWNDLLRTVRESCARYVQRGSRRLPIPS
jgi:hypothetical protein